jgi:hypothetical protein
MAVPAGQTYHYSPLRTKSSIRLLRILSGPQEPTRCSLEVVDLDHQPLYDCLSYTWGDPLYHDLSAPQDIRITTNARIFPIICGRLVICVTENLHEALLQLSHHLHQRQGLIWIDAICIDQENLPERSSQVDMMNRIYRSSQTVIVWLGISDVHSAPAIEVINRLSAVPLEKSKLELPQNLDDPELYRVLGIPYIEPQQWLDYGAFLQRTWFGRIWVIQEIAVAQRIVVLCGAQVVLWTDIIAAAKLLKETQLVDLLVDEVVEAISCPTTSPGYVANILTNPFIFENVKHKAISLNLEKLLAYSKYFNATDDRDRVFAILGLWEQDLKHKEVPDYIEPNYQLSVEHVYATAAWATIREMADLNVLSLVEDSSFSPRKVQNCPSWVPDYSVTPKQHPLIHNLRAAAGEERWKASNGLTFTAPIQEDLLLLPVDGIQVDIITTFAATEAEITNQQQLKTLLELLAQSIDVTYPSGSSPIEAFWRTLLKDTVRGRSADAESRAVFPVFISLLVWELETALSNLRDAAEYSGPEPSPVESLNPDFAKFSDRYAQTKALINTLSQREDINGIIPTWDTIQRLIEAGEKENEGVTESPEKKRLDRDVDAILESFRIAYSGRRLFLTKHNYIGIAAQSLQKGDSLWILAGANVPMVLRRLPSGNWMFVGEAYMYGIMNGEAVEGHQEELERICLE